MQDYFAYAEYNNNGHLDQFYGIFDGHSSTAVSDYLSQTLSLMIFSHPLYSENIQ